MQSGKIEQKVECGTYCKIILVTGLFWWVKRLYLLVTMKYWVYSQHGIITDTIYLVLILHVIIIVHVTFQNAVLFMVVGDVSL